MSEQMVQQMEELMARPFESCDFCGNCKYYCEIEIEHAECGIDGNAIMFDSKCDAFERAEEGDVK
ncbi:MAG: hypothetical protein ABUJ92_00765 [Desulfobacterales bacterium]